MACLWIRYDDECTTAGGRGSEDRLVPMPRVTPVTGWLASRLRGGSASELGVTWSCAGHALPEVVPNLAIHILALSSPPGPSSLEFNTQRD